MLQNERDLKLTPKKNEETDLTSQDTYQTNNQRFITMSENQFLTYKLIN